MGIELTTKGLDVNQERFRRAPMVLSDLIEKNLRSLGMVIGAGERRVLKVVRYRGELARSVSTAYTASPPAFYQIAIGPTAAHGPYVYFGTKPHWAPIGPLKEWAAVKLGDANAAYAVQKSIAHSGTSVNIERMGLGDGHGGYDFLQRTLMDGRVQTGIARTIQRIPLDLKFFIDTGDEPAVPIEDAGSE